MRLHTGCPKAVVLHPGCTVEPHSLGNPDARALTLARGGHVYRDGEGVSNCLFPGDFKCTTRLPLRAQARLNIHFRSACDCVLEWPLGWCVESLMRLCLLYLSLVCCPWRKCPVTVATKEERTGWNPITFLVETNIWTAPHPSPLPPSHYHFSCTAIHLYFEKPLERIFFFSV